MLQQLAVAIGLVALSVAVQCLGMAALIYRIVRQNQLQKRRPSITRGTMFLIRVCVALIAMRIVQVYVWAVLYFLAACFGSFEESFYFSLDCYTTLGFGDVLLPTPWRLLGGFEAATGILMFGCSTAFLFALAGRMYHVLSMKMELHEEKHVSVKRNESIEMFSS